MATDRFLIDYLPQYMQDYMEIANIMGTEQPEIDKLWGSIEAAFSSLILIALTLQEI